MSKYREYNLKSRYGMSEDDYEVIYDEQNGICPICGDILDRSDVHIDHDHTTDKVRGLLHGSCNRGLGLLGDDVDNLNNAINYLDKYRNL